MKGGDYISFNGKRIVGSGGGTRKIEKAEICNATGIIRIHGCFNNIHNGFFGIVKTAFGRQVAAIAGIGVSIDGISHNFGKCA